MQAIARMMAIGMTIAVMLTVTLAFVGSERAHALTYGSGCAEMLENPTDANCQYYAEQRYNYFHQTNDRYGARYHWLKTQGYKHRAHIKLMAAEYTCRGTLYEDFSCSGYKR